MQEISLDVVRRVLRSAIGRESFVASFIKHVEANPSIASASIDATGTMRYSPSFVQRFVETEQDIFCLVMHEIMHPLFGHLLLEGGQLENVAADMVINATIYHVFSKPSNAGSLFKKIYGSRGIQGLLRDGSRMHGSRYVSLYGLFYGSSQAGRKLSTGEVVQTLKVLSAPADAKKVLLLGTHGKNGRGARSGFSADIRSRLADDVLKAGSNAVSAGVGSNSRLYTLFIETIRGQLSLRTRLLEQFLTKHKVDRFLESVYRPRVSVTPIPIKPSKRDLVLLAGGLSPVHYHNIVSGKISHQRGLAVYLDVSGSVNQHLPQIVGILRPMRSKLESLFLFSNKVVETPFSSLLTGRVETTYGTDFDCIAESVLQRGFDKIVVLTDGYASMSSANSERLLRHRLQALTILFGGTKECRDLQPFGDVLRLD